MSRTSILTLLLVSIILHCDFTSHSYNMGKTLNPGEGRSTLGFGVRQVFEPVVTPFSQDTTIIDQVQDSLTIFYCFSFCYNFRLGVLERYPFGNGLEIGMNMEYPGQTREYNSPVIDFDIRFGFPSKSLSASLFHHNIAIGWTTGGWVDNGWFIEYATGFEYKRIIPYTNTRLMLTPTDISRKDVFMDSKYFKQHNQKFNIRHIFGIAIHLKKRVILPDYIIPEISLTYPHYSYIQKVNGTYHFGLTWENGF